VKTIALTMPDADGHDKFVSYAVLSSDAETLRDEAALVVEIFDRETDGAPVPVSIRLPRDVLKAMLRDLESL